MVLSFPFQIFYRKLVTEITLVLRSLESSDDSLSLESDEDWATLARFFPPFVVGVRSDDDCIFSSSSSESKTIFFDG